MTQIVFDGDVFRKSFPAFADESLYPDECVSIFWDMATCYISDQTNCLLDEKCLTLLINLMTAHLVFINNAQEEGGDTAMVEQATIDDVMVKSAIPDVEDPFTWWMLQTSYGKQYYSLISSMIAGGFYAGGSLDISAFRRAAGDFNA
jgi:hypothetical protein